MIKVALLQMDPVVGDFEANFEKIKSAYSKACQEGARILVTPELGLCGYPLYDLLDRPEVFQKSEKGVRELQELTQNNPCAIAVGHVARNPSQSGRSAQNVVSVLDGGKQVFRQAKSLLPTYDVFDEARYFEPASEIQSWDCDGIKVGFAICEDLWAQNPVLGRRLYGKDPIQSYRGQGIELLISLASSPFEAGKSETRVALHAEIAKSLEIPLIYVNQVGATDEILFDGGSFALDAQGKLVGQLPFFKTDLGFYPKLPTPEVATDFEILSRALVTGIAEYFKRTGMKKAILGLSGGIDSAVVAVLAAKALGPKNVLGVAMPSQYSASYSLEDAENLARKLGIAFEVRPIKFLFATASRELGEGRGGKLAPIALENMQARLRALTLMSLANHDGAMVLTTGNKSELATGYCTLYGDMAGGLAPIGDVFKTAVYALANYINETWGAPIPERTITRPPSAELSPNQTDQDTLPPYEDLDPVLSEYLEKNTSLAEILKAFPQQNWIHKTISRVQANEYKRRQAPPVLKVSVKSFGIGRRIPIAKKPVE